MKAVWVGGRQVALDPRRAIGQGGEAEVYEVDGKALKVYKEPDHPDYQGDPVGRNGARERLEIHQRKLPAFPRSLPGRVIAPLELATDRQTASVRGGRRIVGYTMPFLKGAEVLMRYADPAFRQAGIANDQVRQIFLDLHDTVGKLHRAGVVIGDFNDLNVLVAGSEAHLIDADSFQFRASGEQFWCMTFTTKFVDPLRCDPNAPGPVLCMPHCEETDWYAFSVLLMECLLYVDPYGGVYRPREKTKLVAHTARPLHRITVFHPEVRYPKPAVPYGVLPDELLQWFHQVFEKDARDPFPRPLLEVMRWATCAVCGTEHARPVCPRCAAAAPGVVREVTRVRGTVTATRIFQTEGLILFADAQGGTLSWLYHERGAFIREDGTRVATGPLTPGMRFRLRGRETLMGQGGRLVTLAPGAAAGGPQAPTTIAVDGYGALPQFDTNARHTYWLRGGQIRRSAPLGEAYLGDVLAGQTLFWVGPEFGFGFYRAGAMSVGFVFDAEKGGVNDRVPLPPIRGHLLDSTCLFGQHRAWFFVATREGGRTLHQCALVRPDGSVEATAQAEAGDNSWLGHLRGKCAANDFLLAATDDGIVRVELLHDRRRSGTAPSDDGTSPTPSDQWRARGPRSRGDRSVDSGKRSGRIAPAKEFPDTEPFVDARRHLLPGPHGLYVVGPHDIQLLKIA
jgi:tRNA A-37 threonylcarbamoyl transferase component Bud32